MSTVPPLPDPGAPASGSPLSRMRLTELLDEVQERLVTVARTQTRVQDLLDAFLSVASGLDLDTTLQKIVEAASVLVDARYGALGVLDATGGLGAFITVGVPPELAAGMGQLPQGRGVLGQLITDPRPLRIADLRQHPASAGFPPGHPPMSTFLGVPVLVRGEVFGNLYMTDKRQGEFTAEDEAVLTALAGAAGIAVDNARMYERSETHRRWLAAVGDVRAELLAGAPTDEVFGLVVRRVASLTGADGAWLLQGPTRDGGYLVQAQWTAHPAPDRTGHSLDPAAYPLLTAVSRSDTPVTVDWPDVAPGGPHDGSHPPWGPVVAVPLRGADVQAAVLVAARRAGAQPFDTALEPLISSFADQVALALDMAARQLVARQLDVYADRDRIARDLHDHVVQRLFAAGLSLQAAASRVSDPAVRDRLTGVVDQLDETVREIRTSIFDLHTTDGADHSDSLRRRVLDAVTQAAGAALHTTVRMSGAVDTLLTGALAGDVEAVVREAVSNAARHSGAGSLTVTLDVTDRVVVDVADDGRGTPRTVARSGLANLAQRAHARGGELELLPVPGGGTRLHWHVPLP